MVSITKQARPSVLPPHEVSQDADDPSQPGWLGTILRITQIALRAPIPVAIAVICTVLAAAAQLAIPVLLGRAVDQTQQVLTSASEADQAQRALLMTALFLLGISALRGIFTTLQNYFAETVGHRVGYELRLAYYRKIQDLEFGFHDRVHSGDLITLGMLDLEGVRMFFSTGLIRLILLTVLIGAGGWILFATDPMLALFALSFVPFVAWRSSVTRLRLRATWLELQERLSRVTRVMEENLAGIKVVRSFAGQNHEMNKFRAASTHALEIARSRVGIRVRNTSIMTLSFFAAMGLVLWFGGNKVIAGEMSVGTLAAFLTFMTILQMPVRQLGMLVNSFARASTCGSRLFELLDRPIPIKENASAPDLNVTERSLTFDNVGFHYPGVDRPVLRGISFDAKRGETIGIVGPPGSGKSTIAHLIPRFYDATSGRILVDGQDIAKVRLSSLRQAVAVVQQDVFLFTTTIENNIAYGDPWARQTQIAKASETAQLHDYVLGLPNQYGTIVGERGASLSGGQRQRVSIARLFMMDPAIVVFDDSTAALDANTERRIHEAMRAHAEERVTIIIAHRLNSLSHADRILFVEDGRIVEQGTHTELIAQNGRYAELYELQMRPGERTPDEKGAA